MIIPKEIPFATGKIVFSYGDERCEYPSIDVYQENNCYIETEPMYTECAFFIEDNCSNEKKIAEFLSGGNYLKLTFKEDGEAISIKVHSNGNWYETHTDGIKTFKNGDELLIMAKEGTITIVPNEGCDNVVKVVLKKITE
jgi:hypothetical protein